jgi:hypothetical protein
VLAFLSAQPVLLLAVLLLRRSARSPSSRWGAQRSRCRALQLHPGVASGRATSRRCGRNAAHRTALRTSRSDRPRGDVDVQRRCPAPVLRRHDHLPPYAGTRAGERIAEPLGSHLGWKVAVIGLLGLGYVLVYPFAIIANIVIVQVHVGLG